MKRLLISFLIFTLLLSGSLTLTYAQEFDFKRAYQDYIYNYGLYRNVHLNYEAAKTEYYTYQTFVSKTKALEATKQMMLARSDTLRTYLTAVRMKLRESTNVQDYQQNLYYIKLDDEIAWIEQHKNTIPSPGSLEDIVKISSQFESRFSNTIFLSYQVRGLIFAGRVDILKEKVRSHLSITEERIIEMRENNVEVSNLERWLIEAKQKFLRSEEKFRQAQTMMSSMKNDHQSMETVFNSSIGTFEEANQYLKETITDLKEIIREIKRV